MRDMTVMPTTERCGHAGSKFGSSSSGSKKAFALGASGLKMLVEACNITPALYDIQCTLQQDRQTNPLHTHLHVNHTIYHVTLRVTEVLVSQ